MGKKSKGVKSKDFGKINKAWLADKVKAKRQAVKEVEIRRNGNGFLWEARGAVDYPFTRPFTAKRGAQRHFKEFIAKGGKLVFLKNY